MPTLRQIRRRIRSVQNTAKVTKAMEMVAAAKMRRAQQATLAGRPYAQRILELLGHLAAQPMEEENIPPLLQRRPVQRVELVHITPDRGLCGALPSNLNRTALRFMLDQQVPVSVIAVGRKGRDFMARYGRDLRAVFTNLGDRPTIADLRPLLRLVIDDFTSGYADAVYLVYAQFVNTVVQRPVVQQLLPVVPARLPPGTTVGYIYEPRSLEVLEALLPRYVEMEVYHAVLESLASEHSARMVAMRNATDNAKSLVRELTLLANKVRQETITKELLDIIGGTLGLRTR
ncbi:MAG: ATP synthase F1 subunit gamma [Dehalococcoidia bacterium]|nr:ATP synthase F1 subunit gamma [Dehalococcoidia bacterium]MDW8119418.1 ATP synthase F1 subunit gamma [Chloroflexota bacterium]